MTAVPQQSSCQIVCWILSALGGVILAVGSGAVLPVFISAGLGVAFAAAAALFLQKNVCGLNWTHWGPFEGLKGVPGWDSDESEPLASAPGYTPSPAPASRGQDAAGQNGAGAPANAATVVATDDLKKLNGVGPKLEALLNEHGVTRFEQIAAWTPKDVAEIEEKLRFKGRIEREDWIGQARDLSVA